MGIGCHTRAFVGIHCPSGLTALELVSLCGNVFVQDISESI